MKAEKNAWGKKDFAIVLAMAMLAAAVMFFVIIQRAEGAIYGYEKKTLISRESRDGKNTDNFRELGGRVTQSAIFEQGVHLESNEKNAMAAVIYQMAVSRSASSLAIRIAYQGTGNIFVVDVSQLEKGETDFGITFNLPEDQNRQTLYLATTDRYIDDDGIVEIHAIVIGKQELDIEYIELESLRFKPTVRVVERYWDLPVKRRTIYSYYYRGPIYIITRPCEHVVYDEWWHDTWYIGWRLGIRVRVRRYPVRYYRHNWRQKPRTKVVHVYHHYYGDNERRPKATDVDRLPVSREAPRYDTTRQRRRSSFSRSRLDRANVQRTSRSVARESSNTPSRRPTNVRDTSKRDSSRIRIVQPDGKTSSSNRRVVKQRSRSTRSTSVKKPTRSSSSSSSSQRSRISSSSKSSRVSQQTAAPTRSSAGSSRSSVKQRRSSSSSSSSLSSSASNDDDDKEKKQNNRQTRTKKRRR